MHVVTQENSRGAVDAVRDILLMYVNVAEDGFIAHNADWPIRFDPLMYVDAVQDHAQTFYVDMDLLRAGSALAMVARYFSAWSEALGVHAWKDTERYAAAVAAGRLAHLPGIEAVLVEHLSGRHAAPDDPWFDQVTPALCETCVRRYFRRLGDPAPASSSGTQRGPADWIAV